MLGFIPVPQPGCYWLQTPHQMCWGCSELWLQQGSLPGGTFLLLALSYSRIYLLPVFWVGSDEVHPLEEERWRLVKHLGHKEVRATWKYCGPPLRQCEKDQIHNKLAKCQKQTHQSPGAGTHPHGQSTGTLISTGTGSLCCSDEMCCLEVVSLQLYDEEENYRKTALLPQFFLCTVKFLCTVISHFHTFSHCLNHVIKGISFVHILMHFSTFSLLWHTSFEHVILHINRV